MGSAQIQGELWDQAPSEWAYLQEPFHNPLFEAMLHAAHVETGTRLLDAGCGGGGASVLAVQRGAQISGLDAAPGLVDIASERVASGDFHVGDIEDLPFPDDTFDVVIAANSVQYAADRVAALRELKRVCVPNGRVVIGLFGSAEHVEMRHVFKAVREALPEPPPGDGPFGLSAPGKLEGFIEEAGLTVRDSSEVNCPFLYSDFDTFWRANAAAGPFYGAIRAIGVEKLQTAVRAALDMCCITDDGIQIAPNVFKYVVAVQ